MFGRRKRKAQDPGPVGDASAAPIASVNLLSAEREATESQDYPSWFRDIDRSVFTKAGITPDRVRGYPERFGGLGIKTLIEAGVPPEARDYDERFGWFNVIAFHQAGVTPTCANAYGRRFTHLDIPRLHAAGIGPTEADTWPRLLTSREIVDLQQAGMGPQDYGAWGSDLAVREIVELHSAGLGPAEFATYPSGMSLWRIRDLHLPYREMTDSGEVYPQRFSYAAAVWLARCRIEPRTSAAYPGAFNAQQIRALYAAGIDGQCVARFPTPVSPRDLLVMRSARLDLAEAAAANARFSVPALMRLHAAGVSLGAACDYPDRFNHPSQIIALDRACIDPHLAATFPSNLGVREIVALVGPRKSGNDAASNVVSGDL